VWGYRRLSKPARSIAANLAYPGDELKRLIAESLWEVHAREAAPEPSERDGLAAARGRSPADHGCERAG
jgi:hypothetical protein